EYDYVISTQNRPLNEWHHLAVTYDRLAGVARVYVDGHLANQRNFTIVPSTDLDIYLGIRPTDTHRLLGKIDDVRIYNRTLNAQEVLAVFSGSDINLVYQDFEPNNGSDQYGWSFAGATTSLTSEQVHGGARSWKFVTPGEFAGTGIQSQTQRWDMNFHPDLYDRLTFWIRSSPANNAPNTVKLKFFDTVNYLNNGFEVWTTKTAQVGQWSQLEVLYSQLPPYPQFDLNHVNKLEFFNYWSGTYYLDDIQIALRDRAYQSFENCPNAGDCGWAWDGSVALESTIVKEGQTSWKLVTTNNWAGTGIRSQERRYAPGEPDQQSYWHVDLNPQQNDELTFWFYNLAANGMANNLAVQFFDHGNHFVDPVVIWTQKRAAYDRWSKMSIPFSALPASLDLTNINKIQFQVFWPGTYYIDDIRAAKSKPQIDEAALAQGVVQWQPVNEAFVYELQESLQGPQGPWTTIYSGTNTNFTYDRLTPSWLRLRWMRITISLDADNYTSDWTEPVAYAPPSVVLDYSKLQINDIYWNSIPQAQFYQVQSSLSKNGPWSDFYSGTHTFFINQAIAGRYYRVRGYNGLLNNIDEATAWSPAITYNPNGHVQAVGQKLKENLGGGPDVLLRGFNLGNLLLIEPEFVGIGGAFTPTVAGDDDDFGIRNILTSRFGSADLLEVYQDAYIQAGDLDNIMRTGAGLVRLPIYYKAVQDGSGQFTQFDKIDEIINLCASRGLYVLLDLHGAPGGQSNELHSGQANLNKLFENSSTGQSYRNQTVAFWQAVAQRYKDNPMVAGYDLLNEPFGAVQHDPTFVAPHGLWTLYNTLYQAVRAIDSKHLIVMEGVPGANDWDTLPNPSLYGWQNVMYQFHFYCFTFDNQGKINGTCDINAHQAFINGKVAASRQGLYNVPVLIGEFNGFDNRVNWLAHLNAYKTKDWHWSVWSYKSHPNLANWGIYIHEKFDEAWPDVSNDSESELAAKFAKYDTAGHHVADLTLIDLLKEYLAADQPVTWKDLVGVSASANTITKTASAGWGNGGAASVEVIAGDGGIDILAEQT
ncbi:MAG TPA: cellulase family glycosylhydrolase, partial [Candidatus Entotheonella sp.]